MSDSRVIITDESTGKSLELPVLKGTEGEPTLSIKALPSTLGYFTYDPGYTATASCTSKITFIDGGKGILRYRGYPIEQLAEKAASLKWPTYCCRVSCRRVRSSKDLKKTSDITR